MVVKRQQACPNIQLKFQRFLLNRFGASSSARFLDHRRTHTHIHTESSSFLFLCNLISFHGMGLKDRKKRGRPSSNKFNQKIFNLILYRICKTGENQSAAEPSEDTTPALGNVIALALHPVENSWFTFSTQWKTVGLRSGLL